MSNGDQPASRRGSRRTAALLALGATLFFCTSASLLAQSVAFTFDDGPRLEATPRLGPEARNQALLDALKRHGVRAALFVTLGNGADRPGGLALARAWGEAGHFVANHTVTHLDLNSDGVTVGRYTGEILACDAAIRPLPGFRNSFLKERGLRNAYVSLDTSDWRLDAALVEVLKANPRADLAPFRTAYLAHLRQRAEAYRDLSRRLLGRDVPQVLLLHHNLLNALFLEDAIGLFERMGWTVTDPETAYRDFVYTLEPQRPAPGQSLLLSIARSLGYRPDGWERLVDDGDAEIDALRRRGVLPAAGAN